MDTKESTLAQLKEKLRQESLVKGIEDLQVGDIVYYDMDRADGIVPLPGYDTRLKYGLLSTNCLQSAI